MTKNPINNTRELAAETLKYARDRDYIGYGKADGLSSKILQTIPIENKWLNIIFQESCKRAPINIRPLLFVEQRRNYKGISLFASANSKLYTVTNGDVYKNESIELCDWLIDNQATGYGGFCVGNNHPVQMLDHKKEVQSPSIVSTSYATQALLNVPTNNKRFIEIALTAADFVYDDLDYTVENEGAFIKYTPNSPEGHVTLNANALGARMFTEFYLETGEIKYKQSATEILEYIASKQHQSGGWMYRYPSDASRLSMDNYHNGFIIESFLKYQKNIQQSRFTEVIKDAMRFYREELFDQNGAPNWDESNAYPKDIHAAAQGIIIFTQAGNLKFAKKIIDWTIENLYAGDGQFYYQVEKRYTKRFTLMRWCQAWMAYAICSYLNHIDHN